MFILNQASIAWVTNVMIGIIWLVLLVDWISFFVLLITGVVSACAVYYFQFGNITIYSENFSVAIINYIFVIITAAAFSRRKALMKKHKEREQALSSLAGAIAHEMRTPLSNIMVMGQNVEKMTEKLDNNLEGTDLGAKKPLRRLYCLSHRIISVSKRAESLIQSLLVNIRQNFYGIKKKEIILGDFFKKIQDEYFFQNNQRQKLHIKIAPGLRIKGDENTLMHVFFNLLKNSFYFIHSAGKGEIFINAQEKENQVEILFMDTGPGIEKHHLKNIFQPFFSHRPHGSGIGLAFCKRALESMDASIEVDSKYGDYTEFKIIFPKPSSES